jgi:hypothetical protein
MVKTMDRLQQYDGCRHQHSHHLSQAAVYLPTSFLLFAKGLPSVVRTAKTDKKID